MDPYVAEIRIFANNFAPVGWALCNGQTLPISQNTALFSLLGTQYGGNGQTTFGLPNLQGRVAMGKGQGPGLSSRVIGELTGNENQTLISAEVPAHNHLIQCSTSAGTDPGPGGNIAAAAGSERSLAAYNDSGVAGIILHPAAISSVGSGAPHNNMAPYLVLNVCIALQGVFPARN